MIENLDNSNSTNGVKNNEKALIKTWLTGHSSCTLIIPKDFAKIYGLDKPSHVIVEGTPEGILIRKLKF